MLSRPSSTVELSHCFAAIANVGLNWSSCWEGLTSGARRFSDGKDAHADWPPCSPLTTVLATGPFAEPPLFSKRCAQLVHMVGLDLKSSVDAICARSPDARIVIIVASSAGDSGPLSTMVDASFKATGASEPITDAVLEGYLSSTWLDVLTAALQRDLPGSYVFGACASALVAVSAAADRLNADLADAVIVVAVDGISRLAAIAFMNIGAASKEGATPYATSRDGTTVGEGAIGMILARQGVLLPSEVTAKVAGTAVYCDAAHMVEPSPEGVANVIRSALNQAQLQPSDVAGVYWHGTGTRQNDKTEAAASALLFGAMSPPCTSTKGVLGHTMGASSGFNVFAAATSITTGLMPHAAGTVTSEYPNLDVVLNAPRSVRKGPMVITALGFGGINAAAVLTPPTHV